MENFSGRFQKNSKKNIGKVIKWSEIKIQFSQLLCINFIWPKKTHRVCQILFESTARSLVADQNCATLPAREKWKIFSHVLNRKRFYLRVFWMWKSDLKTSVDVVQACKPWLSVASLKKGFVRGKTSDHFAKNLSENFFGWKTKWSFPEMSIVPRTSGVKFAVNSRAKSVDDWKMIL